jgi:ADP-ribosyl-[dinitrogen reductase] hydrolase
MDMTGGGPFRLKPGEWTDDTSMALCLATSLVEHEYDPRDQMDRYCRWADEGYLSSTGHCFDIGNTVATALARFKRTGEPYSGSTDPHAAGNGCLMRLAPVPMYFFPDYTAAVHYAGDSARTTHGTLECIQASQVFGAMLFKALDGCSKDEILFGTHFTAPSNPPLSRRIQGIADSAYRDRPEEEIRGSGYVVDCLEAALWCFHRTESYKDAVLLAANLGEDADTTAAVCGQLAGAFYGEGSIPTPWLEKLAMRETIASLALRLMHQPD